MSTGTTQALEPDFWRARSGSTCKGCGQPFEREARAERYCKACLAAGKGWSGRKDRQPQPKAEEARQSAAPTVLAPRREELVASVLRDLTGPHPLFFPGDLAHGWAPEGAWRKAIGETVERGLAVTFQAGYRITTSGIVVAGPPKAVCPQVDLRGRARRCERCEAWKASEQERRAA